MPDQLTIQQHPRLVLTATILASSLSFIDSSVVNVGLPAISANLSAGDGGLSWVVNGYLLPLSALLLIAGAAGDVFGRRRLLVLGVALFMASSLLCAVAPSLPWLVAGRVVQGMGGAMMMPNSLAILGNSFSGAARGRAIGIWAAFGAAMGAVGPFFGGWLIDAIGWRAIFLINLPLAMGAIFLALRYIADDHRNDRTKLDLLGAGLATITLLALTWGLTIASEARALDSNAGLLLALGVLGAVLFIWIERRRGDAAMLPLALFASSSFTGLMLVTLLLYGALGGFIVLIPYVLIESEAYSATLAGAALMPLPLVMAVASPQMGKIAGRIGSRLPLTIGPLIVAVGFVATARIGGPGSYWVTAFPAMLLISVGLAAAVAPLTTAVLASVSSTHTGVASGLNSAIARAGGLIATAFVSGVLASHGTELLDSFHIAAWVSAAACVAAGLAAFIWVGRR